MLNMHISYNPPNPWRILFPSGGCPRQFSCLKFFRDLVVTGGGCRKGVILQGILMPTGVLPNVQSCLRKKVDVTGASVHAPRQINSTHVHTVRRYIYETILTEQTHLPIRSLRTHYSRGKDVLWIIIIFCCLLPCYINLLKYSDILCSARCELTDREKKNI